MTELENNIITLRKDDLSYKAIQLRLGNPSKKFIKETLRKFCPELAGDTVTNYGKLQIKY